VSDLDDLISTHAGLVGYVVAKQCCSYLGTPHVYNEDDATQDGYLGLMRAGESFDPGRGVRFSTYAVTAIRSEISHGYARAKGSSYRHIVERGGFYRDALSIFLPLDESHDLKLIDQLADRPEANDRPDAERERMIDELLASLSERDRIVVTNQSREAAELLGIKQASASRRRQRIYDRLRLEQAS